MADGLTFNAERHEYRHNGSVVPSVTQVLGPLYDWSMVKEELLRLAAERGDAVHTATELDDLGDLDESSVDPAIAGYLEAWRKFRADTGFVPDLIEQRVYHPLHRYAGTLDRGGMLGKRYALIDIKTSSQLHPATAIQTAGYAAAHLARGGRPFQTRHAVKLQADGRYSLSPSYTDQAGDFAVFLSLLTVARYREQHA